MSAPKTLSIVACIAVATFSVRTHVQPSEAGALSALPVGVLSAGPVAIVALGANAGLP